MTCYLDNSATTRPTEEVVAAINHSMREGFYNPSSLYAPSVTIEKQMNLCRQEISNALHADQVLFTSGGTEANNLAILGALRCLRNKGKVLYSAGEHPSVKEACLASEEFGFEPIRIPLLEDGRVDLSWLNQMLNADTAMICVMQVNNETGTIQPLDQIALLKKQNAPQALFHVDGVQGFLRHPLNMQQGAIDSYALSGHKIHAPKGVGALALSSGLRLKPLNLGGGQEKGLRSGTENTPGIAGLHCAIRNYPMKHNMRDLKLLLYSLLKEGIEGMIVNGPAPDDEAAADHILNLSLPPVRAETMLHALEGSGVFVGNGSACSSKKIKISAVLSAMGISEKQAECALRFSLNPWITSEEIHYAATECIRHYTILRRFVRR